MTIFYSSGLSSWLILIFFVCFNGKKSSLCHKATVFCPFFLQMTRALSFFRAVFTYMVKRETDHPTDYLLLSFLYHFLDTKRRSQWQTAGDASAGLRTSSRSPVSQRRHLGKSFVEQVKCSLSI